jgi:hypothetical protein
MSRKNKLILGILTVAILAVGGYFLLAKKSGVSGVVYRNEQYGFQVSLPDSWKGYSVITGTREIRDVATGDVVATAPTIKLRNPLWTAAKPYEDLPIDIYTPAQWVKIIGEQYSVSAAPIPPSELAHNNRYIFALPARYNYDFSLGYEELDQLVRSGIVSTF